MNVRLRNARPSDVPFLREMLYEAVFWRRSDNPPSPEIGLAFPDVQPMLADWGSRPGDTAVIATVNARPVGAAWYRSWSDSRPVRGYIRESIPVVAIAVAAPNRGQGIGTRLLTRLSAHAAKASVSHISLSVSKDNAALRLYRRQGFTEVQDMGDWLVMVRRTAALAPSRPGYLPPDFPAAAPCEPCIASPESQAVSTLSNPPDKS